MQGRTGLAIAAPVQAMAIGLARRGRYRASAAQAGEGGLVGQALKVVNPMATSTAEAISGPTANSSNSSGASRAVIRCS